jgi:hypothetical protein
MVVFRPSLGRWFFLYSSSGATLGKDWGGSGDVPIPGRLNP